MSVTPFQVGYLEDHRLLIVEGDVDSDSVTVFERYLGRFVADGGGVVDVSQASFFPSMALSAIVVYRRRAAALGARFEVRAAEGTIAHRVLVATGLLPG